MSDSPSNVGVAGSPRSEEETKNSHPLSQEKVCVDPKPNQSQSKAEDITDIQEQCKNFLLDLEDGQRTTESSPEQRLGMTVVKMRDINMLLCKLVIALDKQIMSSARDTYRLQHLMKTQMECAQLSTSVAEKVLEDGDVSSKTQSEDDPKIPDTDKNDELLVSPTTDGSEARGPVSPSEHSVAPDGTTENGTAPE